MNVKLILVKGQAQPRTICIRAEKTVIGRHRDCNLRIASAEVSRRHCLLSLQNEALTVEDLGSLNGTLLNGAKVERQQVIRPGDNLEIGPLTFSVEYETASQPFASPAAQGESSNVEMSPAQAGIEAMTPTGTHEVLDMELNLENGAVPLHPDEHTRDIVTKLRK